MFLGKRSWKSQKVKERRTGSSSSQLDLESFPSAATGCDTGPRSCSSLLVRVRGVQPMSCGFVCTLPLSHVGSDPGAPNLVHHSWPLQGGC